MIMTLIINTADKNNIYLALEKDNIIISELNIRAKFKQSEKLLMGINNIIRKSSLNFKNIKRIKVKNSGDSFTSLRIGVVTANALSYALNIDITNFLSNYSYKSTNIKNDFLKIIKPDYNTKPNITIKKMI
jgi:tRNA A37 threonylcarbamoyladenosine modification protein TsaB